MEKSQNYVRTICEIGIFAAIGFVLDELQGVLSKGLFVNGGSIGFAMIAVLIIGFRRGWLPALLTGLIMGLFDIATSAYILHPAQLMLDYILPYAIVSVGCLFRPLFNASESKKNKIAWLILGTVIGGLAKLLSHYLAGVIFWADPEMFAWHLTNMNPFLYCYIYNAAFIIPSIIITAALLVIIFIRVPNVLIPEENSENTSKNSIVLPIIIVSIISAGALFIFVWYLIKYITSFSDYKDGSSYGYDFDPDSLVLVILSLFIIILCVFSIIKIAKKKFSPLFFSSILSIITISSFIYGLARLIRMYVKHKDLTIYWIWFGVGLFTLAVCITFVVLFYIRRKKTIESNQSA